jgi:hypothetical protein
MNKIQIAVCALVLGAGSAFAQTNATADYLITNDYPIVNIDTGRLWIGNFGTNGGSLLTKSEVASADWFTLFSQFRPNSSLALSNGLIVGLSAGEIGGQFQVGTAINFTDEGGRQGYTPDNASQFAGQDLYFFALNSTSTTWNSTLQGNTYSALLLSMVSGFGDGDPQTGTLAYDISGGVNIPILGSGDSSSVTAITVPEPSTASLFLLGGLAALATRRRQV